MFEFEGLSQISTQQLSSWFSPNHYTDVLRLDNTGDLISGNKWFKLQFYLQQAQQKNRKILTFGGAWSNHIVATAAACKKYNIPCTGIIRGEKPLQLSISLQQANALGMQLVFVNRDMYRQKEIPAIADSSDFIIIPEGGAGEIGVKGAALIANFIKNTYDHIFCAVGTGTTMAGIINQSTATVTGISVMKNNYSLNDSVASFVNRTSNWHIEHDFYRKGYAKYDDEQLLFMNTLWQQENIPTDIVYTGKLFMAVRHLLQEKIIPAGERVLIIHSGGLQGNRSLAKGTLAF